MTALLQLRDIRKAFGAVQAVDDVTLSVAAGEVVAVVGENGAGKSTLMNVACGLYRPDAGEVELKGETVRLRGPRDAIARGVGMVHQHFMLVPTLTVAENVALGCEPRRGALYDARRASAEVRRVSEQNGLSLEPDALVEEIGVGMQQRAEIVKALYRRADVLILDEPTAMLTPQESAELLVVLRRLAHGGKAVVLVSHRLKEVLAVADRIAVMRRGKLVATTKPADTSALALANEMVGPTAAGTGGAEPAKAQAVSRSGVLLAARGLRATGERGRAALEDVSFELRAGEILGVAGVDGNGQAELVEVLAGLRAPDAGEVRLGKDRVDGASPRAIRDRGLAHVPEDRQGRGLLMSMTVAENVALGRHRAPPFAKGSFVDAKGRAARAFALVREFNVRPPDIDCAVRRLSGGNQQKVILARELDGRPRVLVVVQPTRGLDVGATALVHDRLRRARAEGVGILLVSLDLDEVLALSDRILVLHKGRVAGVAGRAEADEAKLGRLMLGQGA